MSLTLGISSVVNPLHPFKIYREFRIFIKGKLHIRVHSRFFDQVGHETMFASSGNKHFFTKSCHCQTYQNYEQSRQKLGTILENKVS